MITWDAKLKAEQLAERPQQTLSSYVHISWRVLQLVYLFFDAFKTWRKVGEISEKT